MTRRDRGEHGIISSDDDPSSSSTSEPSPRTPSVPTELGYDRAGSVAARQDVDVSLEVIVDLVSTLLRRSLRSLASEPSVMREPEPWLTTSDGARHAAVSEDTIREWITTGLLPAGRCGRVLRVRRSDIDDLLLSAPGTPPDSDVPKDPKARAREIVESLRDQGRTARGRRRAPSAGRKGRKKTS